MNKQDFTKWFQYLNDNSETIVSFTVVVTTPGCESPEEITNPICNLKPKEEYYLFAYDENLCKNNFNEIRIVGWYSTNK